jgi:hypothetical protein
MNVFIRTYREIGIQYLCQSMSIYVNLQWLGVAKYGNSPGLRFDLQYRTNAFPSQRHLPTP